MIALLTEGILKDAAQAASVKLSNIELGENRKIRDIQLERLLWALYETGAQNSRLSHLLGGTLSTAKCGVVSSRSVRSASVPGSLATITLPGYFGRRQDSRRQSSVAAFDRSFIRPYFSCENRASR
jgi:hypothetical protein